MRILLILALTFAMSCKADETARAYGAGGKTWTLTEIDGQAFKAAATLRFPETGKIAGQGPCNGFAGTMTTPYPWFDAGPLQATRRACPALADEARFFTALEDMTLIEVLGDVMILKNEKGREMLFRAAD
ncbi:MULTISPECIES: META domain-containing protein [Roseobacteraceae]|jgi:heat shock protein HslJ|uniref:META domain protein n=1 Tax=Pseudosulfitobacter pseudonitzschiae TaxID=1402135 RepID=A0A221K376_9RHOB|nr:MULTISPECIES: META domain-containing protein [Roseobacteraceae]ASM73458.1 META domain protein [Pseudosulfitobacter pseudonitzschiae]